MNFFIFIPSFFVFFYTLHGLVKDDHVFLRKNIKLEQFFDVAIIVIIVSSLFAQFSSRANLSLTFAVLGGFLALFIIGKYKNYPIGRVFDFFTLSFMSSLPILFLLAVIFSKKTEQIINFSSFFVYAVITLLFRRELLAKIMNRTLKDGSLSIYFLMIFSTFSLLASVVRLIKDKVVLLSLENAVLVGLFVFSLILLTTQNRKRLRN